MNKIGWCSMTWNPVWGCLNRGECKKYCYAGGIAKRFWKKRYMYEFNYYYKKHPNWVWTEDQLGGLWEFQPTFLQSQFDKKFPKKPQRIFVGSMSEIYYWNEEWVEMVIEKIKQYPQHAFQFLTKYPCVYRKIVSYTFPKNCWLGITITDNKEAWYSDFRVGPGNTDLIKFVSIEPILEMIEPESLHHLEMDWVIIGAETGNRRGKIIPKKEWIEDIINYCRDNNISVYLKDSLKNIYPVEIKMFPEVK